MMIGSLDRRVTVERPVVSADSSGGPVRAWEPLVPDTGSPVVGIPFWAQVQDVLPSKSESVSQGLSQSRDRVRVRMRWRSDIDSTMRLTVDDGRVLQIVGGPAMIGRQEWLEVLCERYSTTGVG